MRSQCDEMTPPPRLVPDRPSDGSPVAWAVELEDGTIGGFGWASMDTFPTVQKVATLRAGCRYVFAYRTLADFPRVAEGPDVPMLIDAAAPPAEAPGDWVLVPRVMTDEMREAVIGHDDVDDAWDAALAAAPAAPATNSSGVSSKLTGAAAPAPDTAGDFAEWFARAFPVTDMEANDGIAQACAVRSCARSAWCAGLNQVPRVTGGREVLWCLHLRGPDEVHAAPSYEAAQAVADQVNASFDGCEIKVAAVSAPWPHSAESHAESLKEWEEQWTFPAAIQAANGGDG